LRKIAFKEGKATKALSRIHPGYGLRGFIVYRTRGFPSVAALVFVLMVPVCVGVLVTMLPRLVGVLMPVMAVGARRVAMFMLMLVFVVATHAGCSSFS
jgi:hypothetical protein